MKWAEMVKKDFTRRNYFAAPFEDVCKLGEGMHKVDTRSFQGQVNKLIDQNQKQHDELLGMTSQNAIL